MCSWTPCHKDQDSVCLPLTHRHKRAVTIGATWAAILTPRALTCGSIKANHLFLASDIMKGRSITRNNWDSITFHRDWIILTFYNILSSSGGRNSNHTSLWEFQSLLMKLDQWPKSRLQTSEADRNGDILPNPLGSFSPNNFDLETMATLFKLYTHGLTPLLVTKGLWFLKRGYKKQDSR